METITQRRKPQHRGGESAAIALTAQLLSTLSHKASSTLVLRPQAARWPMRYLGDESCSYAWSDAGSFNRVHGSARYSWFCTEKRLDQQGRVWERNYNAVIDDFGNLVEVPA